MNDAPIGFRPIRREDFARLSTWLATPHVARWWDDDPDPQAVEADYGPVVDGTEPAEVFIAWQETLPFGLIQRYRFDAYPEWIAAMAHIMDIPEGALSFDYFIGPPEMLGQGMGTRMIAQFVRDTWAEIPAANCIIVPANASNRGSWRALELAGFKRAASGDLAPDNPIDDPLHHVYRLDRGLARG